MSDATVEAVNYIEKSPYALLVTVGEKNRPFVREIGPFVNDGLDIYFVTRRDSRKVRHVNVNSFVTLTFQTRNKTHKNSEASPLPERRLAFPKEMNSTVFWKNWTGNRPAIRNISAMRDLKSGPFIK